MRTLLLTLIGLVLCPILASSDDGKFGEKPPEPNRVHQISKEISPGYFYVTNFILGPRSRVVAKFSIDNTDLQTTLIAHPKSDLQIVNGELKVKCPGLAQHGLRWYVAEPLDEGSVELLTEEDWGHYGFMWKNTSASVINLEVDIHYHTSRFMFTFEKADFLHKLPLRPMAKLDSTRPLTWTGMKSVELVKIRPKRSGG